MGFTLAPIFNDHLVFQANKKIYIFGEANACETIEIKLLEKTYVFEVKKGEFQLALDPIGITKNPFDVILHSTDQTITLKDCLAGDVYICTGQSNMQYMCKDVQDVRYLDLPNLRLYEVPKLPYKGAEKEFDWLYTNDPKWKKANPETEKTFSAIGYMIGRDIVLKHDIPIGIISCNQGDTTIYSWLSEAVIRDNKVLKPYLDDYLTWKKKYKTYEAFSKYYNEQVPKLMNFWGLLDEYRAKGYSSEKVYELAYEKIPNPYLPMGPKNQNRPAGCYDTMLQTIIPYSNHGIIYYQGENDVSRADEYQVAIKALIESWRKAFKDESIFINCQIAGHIYSETKGFDVARLRDAQASIANSKKKQFVTTAIDYGEASNIHPAHKTVVAKRIFQIIDEYVYLSNENTLCPMLESYNIDLNKIHIFTKLNKLHFIKKDGVTKGFYGLTKDNEIVEIKQVAIIGNTLMIEDIRDFKEIRYGYDGFPELSIYTKNDLPLLPFRIIL